MIAQVRQLFVKIAALKTISLQTQLSSQVRQTALKTKMKSEKNLKFKTNIYLCKFDVSFQFSLHNTTPLMYSYCLH